MPVCYLSCQSDQVTKPAKTATGTQRYRCHNPDCPYQSFLLRLILDSRVVKVEEELVASLTNRPNLLQYA